MQVQVERQQPSTSGLHRRRVLCASVAAACCMIVLLQATARGQIGLEPIGDAGTAYGIEQITFNNHWLAQVPAADPDAVSPGEEVDTADEDEDSTDNGEEALADRLAELEAKYAELEEAQSDLFSSLSNYIRVGTSGSTNRIYGRIHADLWGFPESSPGVNGFETGENDISPADRLGFRRMRIGVGGDIWKNMEYKIEMEFAGGNDVEFRDAYLGWNELPYLQTVLLGNQKRPYGLDHLNSSRYNVFIERPFVIEANNQDARRFGLCAYGVSDDLAWNWRYGLFNQALIQADGNYISDNWQGQIAGRLANTIWYDECSQGRGYAHWAVAGTWANPDGNAETDNYADSGINQAQFRTRPEARTVSRWIDTGIIDAADDYSLVGVENLINIGAFQFCGEYQHVWLERETASELQFHGGYLYLSYFLTGEHLPWDRETGCLDRVEPFENFFLVDTCCDGVRGGWGAWQVAARYSMCDYSDNDIQGGIGESFTLGMNWHWNPWARMQFNYIYGNIYANDLNAVNGINSGDYQVVGARFMVDF